MTSKVRLHSCEIPDDEPEFSWDETERDHMEKYNVIVEMVNDDELDVLCDEDLDLIAFNSGKDGFIPFEDFRQILPRFILTLRRKKAYWRKDFLFRRFVEHFDNWTEDEKSTITSVLLAYAKKAWEADFMDVYGGWFQDLFPFLTLWQNEEVFVRMIEEFKESGLPPCEFFKSLSQSPLPYNGLLRFLLGEKTKEPDISTVGVREPLSPERQTELDNQNRALEKRIEKARIAWGKYPEDPICGARARKKGEKFAREILNWLVSMQTEEGIWQEPDTGHHIPTALALLAFTGNGHTHRVGQYKEYVKKALYSLAEKAGDGSFGTIDILSAVCATWAINEVYAVTRERQIYVSCLHATACLMSRQIPGAGWPARVEERESSFMVTTFAVLALKAAKTAGIDIPDESFEGAVSFFNSLTDKSGRVGDDRDNLKTAPLHTAMATICRIFCGQTRRLYMDAVNIIISYLNAARSDMFLPSAAPFYYFATYALFQYGGNTWRKWLEGLLPDFLDAGADHLISSITEYNGSDRPIFEQPVAATALYQLFFEVIARYTRSFRKWWEKD